MTFDLSIRPARPEERLELIELQRRASLANPGDREVLLAHPEAIDLPSAMIELGDVLVAERDGVRLGFAAIAPRDDGQIELDGLFTEPANWNGGVGRALVRAAGELSRSRGAGILHVIGNPHALGFYERCGFIAVGEFKTQFGVGVLMTLDLGR